MDDLSLIITYKGEELELPVEAFKYGHTYRIHVMVGTDLITFEPDEEGSFRAFAAAQTDKELIAAIAGALEQLK